MHVASSNPIAVDAAGVDAATIEREKTILADKYREQGKPEAAIAKIVESGIKTYFKEVTLLEQPFIFEPSKSVGQAIKESEGAAGGPIKVAGFIRYALGEGIEKQESDFAAEVAAQAGHAA
jgi:elongation factor Ts